jgi:valyl-tRNA synthetase
MEQYDFRQIEDKWYKYWEEKGYFTASTENNKPSFSIVIPPPNVTGSLHMGHALNNTLQDILCRYKRLKGFNVLWMPGTDHAGIATQNVVEKKLAEECLTRHDLGRDKFIERVWLWRKEYGRTIINQLKKLGATCDWSRERFTMDQGLSKAVKEVFVRLYEEGLIYKGDYIINWCPRCHTALSDLEVEMEESKGSLWYIKYPVKDEDKYLVVATTRPETMLGDTAVAVNPTDERYKDLLGKTVVLPVINREIPIIADDYVEKEFGTGVVKITPAHDFNDFMVAMRHNLEAIDVMTDDAKMNENAGEFKGLDRFECRKRLVDRLKNEGLLEKIEDYQLFAGNCYRCKTVVEPRLSKQWFIKIKPLAQKAINAVKNGDTRIIPEQWENNYFGWMENIRDWCISRQIWWGHRIPAWLCKDCNKYSVSKESLSKCIHCGSDNIAQEEDVLDTWFSSALWPFSTMGWPDKTKELEIFYPTSVLITGFDILFFWVARMMMMGLWFMNEVPFKDVYIHALVRDEKGEKMSKSKGNVIDPLVIIDKYGADALRLTLAAFAAQGRDIKLSENRIVGYKNFINKVWNAAKFIIMNIKDFENNDDAATLSDIDKWILAELKKVLTEYEKALEEYRFNEAVSTVYQFTWHQFCDWYIELSKVNLSGSEIEKSNTQHTLVYVFKIILQMLHPFIPFVTEELWHYFDKSGDIMVSNFPEVSSLKKFDDSFKDIENIREIISGIRNIRGELNINPSKNLNLYFFTDDLNLKNLIENNSRYFKKLANLAEIKFKSGDLRERVVKDFVKGVEIYIDIEGVIDIETEINRLNKEINKVKKELDGLNKKLSNENFLAKAPKHVIEKNQTKKAELEEKLNKAEMALDKIKKVIK